MINLLPIDSKREIRAGRTNRVLLRYCVLLGIVAGILVVMIAAVYLYLLSVYNESEQAIAQSNTRLEEIKDDKARVDEFKSNLKTVKAILDKRVDYSQKLLQITRELPGGVVIESAAITPEFLNGQPMTLTARSSNEQAAVEFKNRLNASDHFTSAHFLSIVREEKPPQNAENYPFLLTMSISAEKQNGTAANKEKTNE